MNEDTRRPAGKQGRRLRFEPLVNGGRYALIKRASPQGKSTLVVERDGLTEIAFLEYDPPDKPTPMRIGQAPAICPHCGSPVLISQFDDGSMTLAPWSDDIPF
jgi:hypothetical protein